MVYLATSKVSVVLLGNLALTSILLAYSAVVKIFFGRLNESEASTVVDNITRAIIETGLAMTTFSEDFG